MAKNIDYNRGVMIRQDDHTGISVYMYVDDPGMFLSVQGTPVSLELARSAGYDVDKLTRERILKTRMADAMEKIKAELSLAEEASKVVLEKDGFQVVDIGLGRHQVLAPEGDVLTPQPLPFEQAELLLNQLVPDEKATSVEAGLDKASHIKVVKQDKVSPIKTDKTANPA